MCTVRCRFRLQEIQHGEEGKEVGARSRSRPARVAGGQDCAVRYEAKKDRKSASAVKKVVKKVGNSLKKVRKALSR